MLPRRAAEVVLVVDTRYFVPNQRNADKPFETYISKDFIFRCEEKGRFELEVLAVDRPDVGCWAMDAMRCCCYESTFFVLLPSESVEPNCTCM